MVALTVARLGVRATRRTPLQPIRRSLSSRMTGGADDPPGDPPPLPGPWQRTYDASDDDEMREAYALWAPTYDDDSMVRFGYAGPTAAASALIRHLRRGGPAGESEGGGAVRVLDAGCGTGLVGRELARLAPASLLERTELVGVDYSEAMLAEAARKVRPGGRPLYDSLRAADLRRLASIYGGGTFDAAVCVGTLTPGHCGVDVLDELVRAVCAPGGLVVLTLRMDFHEDVEEGVGSRLYDLEGGAVVEGRGGKGGRAVRLLERTEPRLYTPLVSDEIYFSTWALEVGHGNVDREWR